MKIKTESKCRSFYSTNDHGVKSEGLKTRCICGYVIKPYNLCHLNFQLFLHETLISVVKTVTHAEKSKHKLCLYMSTSVVTTEK